MFDRRPAIPCVIISHQQLMKLGSLSPSSPEIPPHCECKDGDKPDRKADGDDHCLLWCCRSAFWRLASTARGDGAGEEFRECDGVVVGDDCCGGVGKWERSHDSCCSFEEWYA